MSKANRTNPSPKKGLFTRSLIAAALVEAILMGSAMAAGTGATNMPAADSYDLTATDDTASADTHSASDTMSYAHPTNPLFAMGAAQRDSIGVMDTSDPLIAIDGMPGINYASLNEAASTMSALAMGVNSNASGGNTVALGVQAVAASDNAVALGSRVQTGADQPYAVAVGSNASTRGTQAIALGANVKANANNALAVGNNNTQALSQSSIAMGDGARVNSRSDNSIAMGTGASIGVGAANAMALGANTVASAYGSIALGAGSNADRASVLSIGAIGAERQIINVAAGTQLTDAVNVSQLKGVTDALGAGAGVAPDGSITQPEFTVLATSISPSNRPFRLRPHRAPPIRWPYATTCMMTVPPTTAR